MITLLWLIRSFQPILESDKENFWQNEWFLALVLTMSAIVIDLLIVNLLYSL